MQLVVASNTKNIFVVFGIGANNFTADKAMVLGCIEGNFLRADNTASPASIKPNIVDGKSLCN
jgi:hypothetical protein